jgi:hypothetical protein
VQHVISSGEHEYAVPPLALPPQLALSCGWESDQCADISSDLPTAGWLATGNCAGCGVGQAAHVRGNCWRDWMKALRGLGYAAQMQGEYPQATVLLEESLAR